MIYSVSIAGWLFLLLASLSALPDSTQKAPVLAPLAAFGLSVIATWCATTWIRRKKKHMEYVAAKAVQKALSTDLSRAGEDRKELITLCADLGHEERETIVKRAKFYATLDRDSLSYYLPGASKEQAACQLVALLTDLPPAWLFDCATNRRGSTPKGSPVSIPPCADEAW